MQNSHQKGPLINAKTTKLNHFFDYFAQLVHKRDMVVHALKKQYAQGEGKQGKALGLTQLMSFGMIT